METVCFLQKAKTLLSEQTLFWCGVLYRKTNRKSEKLSPPNSHQVCPFSLIPNLFHMQLAAMELYIYAHFLLTADFLFFLILKGDRSTFNGSNSVKTIWVFGQQRSVFLGKNLFLRTIPFFSFRGVQLHFNNNNKKDPDQTNHTVESDLGLQHLSEYPL